MDCKYTRLINTYRPAVDDEDGLGCGVKAALLQTLLPSGLQKAALLVQI